MKVFHLNYRSPRLQDSYGPTRPNSDFGTFYTLTNFTSDVFDQVQAGMKKLDKIRQVIISRLV